MTHSKYESSLPEADRSSVRRTCRTKLLNAECRISMANCLKSSLSNENPSHDNMFHHFKSSMNINCHTELRVHCAVQRSPHLWPRDVNASVYFCPS